MALATPLRQPNTQAETAYGLAYYRVSTSRQANTSFDEDGFSIQAQREYCQRKASELGVELVDEYVDRGKSARTADRPALQAMLSRIKEDTDIQYVFVHKLDRLARNRADDVQIGLLLAKNGVRLVSCTENIDDSPSGKLVRGIMGDIAEWYSSNLSEEAKKGMRKKAELGGTPGKAPLGYVNVRRKITELGKDIGTVEVHKTFGPIITDCFKMYDAGLCTLAEVAAYANDQGLCLPADKRLPERKLTRWNMLRILRNRYYTGWIRYDGVEYKGTHPSLIDEATFERVQALLTARNLNKNKDHKRPHHLKGFIYCALCGHRLGITVVTKRSSGNTYAYFYCLGRQLDREICSQHRIPVGDLEDAVHDYWDRVRIPAERIQALRQAILATFADKQELGKGKIEEQRRRVRELEQRRKKAKSAYFANVLDLAEFKAEQETIRHGIHVAEEAIAKWSVELDSITQALDDALRLVEDPQGLYDALPEGLKVLLMQAVFTRLWILDTRVVGSDLTDVYAELLTREARLALDKDATASGTDKSTTHYRHKEAGQGFRTNHLNTSGQLTVERPYGRLPIDRKNRGLQRTHGWNMQHLVHLRGHKLNSQLTLYLREHPHTARHATPHEHPHTYRKTAWRLQDRLAEKDVLRLVMAYQTGIAPNELAERFGINIKSVRKLLREHGVRGFKLNPEPRGYFDKYFGHLRDDQRAA